jgi:uncharacterized membrane protein
MKEGSSYSRSKFMNLMALVGIFQLVHGYYLA